MAFLQARHRTARECPCSRCRVRRARARPSPSRAARRLPAAALPKRNSRSSACCAASNSSSRCLTVASACASRAFRSRSSRRTMTWPFRSRRSPRSHANSMTRPSVSALRFDDPGRRGTAVYRLIVRVTSSAACVRTRTLDHACLVSVAADLRRCAPPSRCIPRRRRSGRLPARARQCRPRCPQRSARTGVFTNACRKIHFGL